LRDFTYRLDTEHQHPEDGVDLKCLSACHSPDPLQYILLSFGLIYGVSEEVTRNGKLRNLPSLLPYFVSSNGNARRSNNMQRCNGGRKSHPWVLQFRISVPVYTCYNKNIFPSILIYSRLTKLNPFG
jgi:hypothetical protein